ncbi:MAG TPA: acylase [Sphingomonadaceae bacterium]|nr:acylase [Sphingomonadaceae bacterium]
MRIWLRRIGWTVLALLLAAFVTLATWEPFLAQRGKAPPAASYEAEIVRDEFGVPHIHGKRDVDVAFGIAWAHAEDDFSTLQDVLAMTRGRYGAIAGEEGAAIDFAYHLIDARGTAEREYGALPEDVRALVEAYAGGLNRYAEEHPREIKLGNLFPVDGIDIATGFALRQPFFFQIDKVIAPLVAGEDPPRDQGPSLNPLGKGAEDAGSNAFAIAPSRDPDGVTRLVSNTHQPWRGNAAWYELVVESEEGWHFAGATFPGAPFPLLGHNEQLGWTNTVNRPDIVDVYRLELDQGGKNYLLDGQWKPLERDDIRLPIRFGPIVLPVTRTIWRSEHGPVIRNDNGAFAIRYGGMGRIDQLTQYFRLNKARSFAEWKAALAMQAVPSTNFVYADEAGNIFFQYNAAIPQRVAGPDWRGIVDGTRSNLIWREMVPFAAIPHYENPASGYLYNANNTPFSAAGPGSNLSADDFPPEWGVELVMTNRAYRAERLLAQANMIDRATLERIKYDTGWERIGYVARMLDGIAALELSDEPSLREAQRLLATWDLDSDGEGAADALANLVLKEATRTEFNGWAFPDPRGQLEFATNLLLTHFGRLDVPLAELQRLRQGSGKTYVDLPYDGGSDTLRAATNWTVEPDGRISLIHGDSFLMFVEWAPGRKVRSQSIVPFGSATTRPESPHHTDQSALFVRKQLKPVRFERADVLANAVRRYVVTSTPRAVRQLVSRKTS